MNKSVEEADQVDKSSSITGLVLTVVLGGATLVSVVVLRCGSKMIALEVVSRGGRRADTRVCGSVDVAVIYNQQ